MEADENAVELVQFTEKDKPVRKRVDVVPEIGLRTGILLEHMPDTHLTHERNLIDRLQPHGSTNPFAWRHREVVP